LPGDCRGFELRLRLPLQDLDVRCDVSVAPGGVLYLTSNSLFFSSYCWLCSRDTRPGPRLNSLLHLNRRWTAYLRSGLPTFRPTYTTTASHSTWLPVIVIGIVIVHHQFKRNIYLSLLCAWIFLCLQNHFSFLSSKYAVEACDINNAIVADLVHC
jgi:hypothetical protein